MSASICVLLAGCKRATDERQIDLPAESEGAEQVVEAPAQTEGASPREQILAALAHPVSVELTQAVRLEVEELRYDDGWAFVSAVARTASGAPIDYSRTKFAQDVEDGYFDDWLCALLSRDSDGWRVVALEIGVTDAPFVDWPDRYGAPPEIVLGKAK